MNWRPWISGATAVCFCVLAGCGGGAGNKGGGPATSGQSDTARMNELKEISIAYIKHHREMKKAPKEALDLVLFVSPPVQKNIGFGKYVIIADVPEADMTQPGKGASETVLGYESDAPKSGGYVLMLDGSVKNVNAADFQKLPRATPAKSAPPPADK